MPFDTLVVFEDDLVRLRTALERLQLDAGALAVFLVNRNGEAIAAAGSVEHLDATSLASLAAANVAATRGLAQLIGEREFALSLHEGERRHLHISQLAGGAILVVAFDERSTLGLVRLRVKRASTDLGKTLGEIAAGRGDARARRERPAESWSDITDADVEALFRDADGWKGR